MAAEFIETLIVGGGQAGLTMSHMLSKRGRPHLVLERHGIAERWRTDRWNSLSLQTPYWHNNLPDFPFPNTDPDGGGTAAEVYNYVTAYADFINAPIRCGVDVTSLRQRAGAAGFVAETSAGPNESTNVVVATGPFQRPLMQAVLPEEQGIIQITASHYRAPDQLPEGAVLVVGSGASGSQIAEDLMDGGRRVYLSVSRHSRIPRRYRGHDLTRWSVDMGIFSTPVEQLPVNAPARAITGVRGGHTIDFRRMAARGVILLGRTEAARDGIWHFGDDLTANIAIGDAAHTAFMDQVDAYIRDNGLDVPEDPGARATLPDPPCLTTPIRRLDPREEGIHTVIWCTGYGFDLGWLDLPVVNDDGAPLHDKGVTRAPGLYFLGLKFLSKMSSEFLGGVAEDSARLADHIVARG